jgi:hypothetical protein
MAGNRIVGIKAQLDYDLKKERVALCHATRDCAGASQAGEVVVIKPDKLAGLHEKIRIKEAAIEQIEIASAEMIKADGRCLADILAEYSELGRKQAHCTNMFLSPAEQEAEKAAFQPNEARQDMLRSAMRLYRSKLAELQIAVFDLPIPSEEWFQDSEKPKAEA